MCVCSCDVCLCKKMCVYVSIDFDLHMLIEIGCVFACIMRMLFLDKKDGISVITGCQILAILDSTKIDHLNILYCTTI